MADTTASKSAKKWYTKPYFYVPLLLVVLLAVFVGAIFMPNTDTPARIHHAQGTVEVDLGSGYISATNNQELDEKSKIRTGNEGTATVVLYESVLVNLAPNTEISIVELKKSNQQIKQERGSVWSKVARLGGVESFSVQTPTTTATVRGTSFRTEAPDLFTLLVAEGRVGAQDNECTQTDCEKIVNKREKLVNRDGTLALEPLTLEDIAAIREELTRELSTLRELRLREINKNARAIETAKSKYGVTDEQISNYLIEIDEGRRDEKEALAQVPVITPSVKRVLAYNAEIKKVIALLQEYA